MPFVAHIDRSGRGGGFRPGTTTARFLRFLRPQRSLRSARAASCNVPPRSMLAIASVTPMGAKAPDAGTGPCPTDPRATAHQHSMAGILSHRSVYRWPMLLGDGPPGICTGTTFMAET